jgi:GTP-binding conserved hypothetical protein TIGR00650
MLSIALAGKPNAGKSTFYQAATMADVDVGNYPFTTIDPNQGVTHARTQCPCLERQTRCENCTDGIRYVPVELLDVAGLVPGAHEGRGLGNQFLDALTDADAILAVVDAAGATNAEGDPVELGTYDPVAEADFVEEELEQWLAGIIDRNWETVVRQSRAPEFNIDEAVTELLTGFGASEHDIAAALRSMSYPDDPQQWSADDQMALAVDIRERTKPIVLVANKADIAPVENIDRLQNISKPVVPATADGERALRRAADADLIQYNPGDTAISITGDISSTQQEGLETIQGVMENTDGTGVQAAINTAVYDLLEMITVYPVENETRWTDGSDDMLPDAVLLRKGSTPLDLAYAVHSDIGDGYLYAVDARAERRIGEDHELSEGDVVKIVSTA